MAENFEKQNKTHKNHKHYKHFNSKSNYNEELKSNCNDGCDCENDCDCNEESVEIKTETNCRENEFKETLQRLQAEFDNYRKRNESLVEKYKEDGIVYAINKLLPVLDSFKSAKMLVKDEEFLKSLDLIEKQFQNGLDALKITKINAEGEIFNPMYHNAVLTGNDETKQEDEILEVFQDGYILGDRVIRHSVVKINKK